MKKIFKLSFYVAFIVLSSTTLQASSKYESIKIGDFSLGGAVRVNYVQDSSEADTKNASRGDEGVFNLDMTRVNINYKKDSFLGKFEYRWYPSDLENYSFIHTAWIGYVFNEKSQVQVGINRVPFGPTAYGISQSWFFDQHYYVGLADDMDLGIKYSSSYENIKYDLAFYPKSEPKGVGEGGESARYAYDVVDDYHEKNQLNARVIYTTKIGGYDQDFGFSLLYSELESQLNGVNNGDRFSASTHIINRFGDLTLKTQVTRYEMSVDANNDAKDDPLITMGGFNWGQGVASKAWLPGFSLNYMVDTPKISWLDYALPYVEYSNIIKDEDSYNNSYMWMVGTALARGNWYIYTDLALTNGNYFVGKFDGSTNDFGENTSDEMQHRLNINFGYYF